MYSSQAPSGHNTGAPPTDPGFDASYDTKGAPPPGYAVRFSRLQLECLIFCVIIKLSSLTADLLGVFADKFGSPVPLYHRFKFVRSFQDSRPPLLVSSRHCTVCMFVGTLPSSLLPQNRAPKRPRNAWPDAHASTSAPTLSERTCDRSPRHANCTASCCYDDTCTSSTRQTGAQRSSVGIGYCDSRLLPLLLPMRTGVGYC